MMNPEDGLAPKSAAAMMGLLALLGVGFYAVTFFINQKSNDGLYDLNDPDRRTASQVQETTGLWRRKGEEAAPAAQTVQSSGAAGRRETDKTATTNPSP